MLATVAVDICSLTVAPLSTWVLTNEKVLPSLSEKVTVAVVGCQPATATTTSPALTLKLPVVRGDCVAPDPTLPKVMKVMKGILNGAVGFDLPAGKGWEPGEEELFAGVEFADVEEGAEGGE